ncbi:MAG: hypothetical protein GX974_06630, partial [Clostridiales bacterium]|nr:hypothetical protein [Clostridiales bacterium]
KIFTLGNKLRMYDRQGREIIYIEQKLFKFLPEYTIYLKGRSKVVVKKEFTFFRPRFSIYGKDADYIIEGSFLAMDFTILENKRAIAYVSKRWLSWGDTYEVDVVNHKDNAFILALVIIIDQVLHNNKHTHNHS